MILYVALVIAILILLPLVLVAWVIEIWERFGGRRS